MKLLQRDSFWFGLWTLVALVVLWQYDLVNRRLNPDASFMLYAGQEILRGHAPYVSVAIVKLPLAPLLAALGIGLGRVLHGDDILAGRIAFWLCAGITVGAVYLIGAQLVRAFRRAEVAGQSPTDRAEATTVPNAGERQSLVAAILFGSLSAVLLLSSQALGVQVADGPEAKMPMICAGMVCLALISYRRFFWAGIAGALSFMAWQPGLIFPAAVVLAALVVTERKRALVAAVGGIALPLALVGVYLALHGALRAMYHQAFGANANYLGEKKIAVGVLGILLGNVSKVWQVSLDCSAAQVPFVVIAFAGLIGGALFLLWQLARTRSRTLLLTAGPLLLSGGALFGFSLLDLQACSDVTPLLPYLALGGGAVLFAIVLLAARGLTRVWHTEAARVLAITGSVVLVLVLLLSARTAFAQPRQEGLAAQRALAQEIDAQLGPNDRVQEFGETVFLITTNRENATRYVHLGEKQGLGIFTSEGVTMQDLIDQLRAANPRLIALSRAKKKAYAAPLYAWIQANYVPDAQYNAKRSQRNKALELYWKK